MARSVIGIEIAEESIRAVEVTTGSHPTLVAAGEVLLPVGAARDSDVLDSDVVALALKKLWAQAKFRKRKVVLAVANRRLLVREYTAPNLPIEELRAALPYEVQDVLPVPADRAVLDFYPLSQEGNQAHGLLVAGAAEGIEGMIATLRKAKLEAITVDFLPFGLARVVGAVVPAGSGPVAVAAIGEHTTSVVVVVDGIPRYVRIIAADTLVGLHATMAERGEFGDSGPVSTARRAAPTAVPDQDVSPQHLASRIRETLEFFDRQDPGIAPRGLLITGSLALVPEIGAELSRVLNIEVGTLRPAEVIAVPSALAKESLPTSLMGALGVTLGEAKK